MPERKALSLEHRKRAGPTKQGAGLSSRSPVRPAAHSGLQLPPPPEGSGRLAVGLHTGWHPQSP